MTMFPDQTPTPTRFIKNCEEVGLFQDLQKINPFDEQFRKATEGQISALSVLGDKSLDTPNVLGSFDKDGPLSALAAKHSKIGRMPSLDIASAFGDGLTPSIRTPSHISQLTNPSLPALLPQRKFKEKAQAVIPKQHECSDAKPTKIVNSQSSTACSAVSSPVRIIRKDSNVCKVGHIPGVPLQCGVKSSTKKRKTDLLTRKSPVSKNADISKSTASVTLLSPLQSCGVTPQLGPLQCVVTPPASPVTSQVFLRLPSGELVPLPAAQLAPQVVVPSPSSIVGNSLPVNTGVKQLILPKSNPSSDVAEKIERMYLESTTGTGFPVLSRNHKKISIEKLRDRLELVQDAKKQLDMAKKELDPAFAPKVDLIQTLLCTMAVKRNPEDTTASARVSNSQENETPLPLAENSPKRKLPARKQQDPHLADKRKQKLERNRASALRSREKQKAKVQQLMRTNQSLSFTNEKLTKELNAMKAEVIYLKGLLLTHKDCSVTHALQQGLCPVVPQETSASELQLLSGNGIEIRSANSAIGAIRVRLDLDDDQPNAENHHPTVAVQPEVPEGNPLLNISDTSSEHCMQIIAASTSMPLIPIITVTDTSLLDNQKGSMLSNDVCDVAVAGDPRMKVAKLRASLAQKLLDPSVPPDAITP